MPDKPSLHDQMLTLKKVSEALLHQLEQEIDLIDANAVETRLQQREQIISTLAQCSVEERKAFQAQHPEIVSNTRKLGERCLLALQEQGFALNEIQRQMTHGRNLIRTYQPETEQQSHFIEGDA